MKLLHEIRQQPLHIRHLFMWTSVVIAFSLVGFFWFQSTKDNVVALLNPKQAQEAQSRQLAQNQQINKSPSPFALFKNSWASLTANISELWKNRSKLPKAAQQTIPSPVAPQKLPTK